MPQPPVPDADLIAALDLIEEYGSAWNAKKALGDAAPPRNTIEGRASVARLKGLKPSFRKEAPRIYTRQRLGRMHIVIPDVQAKPGVRLDHLDWVGNYIAEKRPDVIINIGDFADMAALSSYDKGTLRGENKRLQRDLIVAREAMERLVSKWRDIPDYKPEMHLTMGNHEERLDRFANEHPYLEEVVGTHMLDYERWGWTVHPFLKPVTIDGVRYCHYFISGAMGRAVSSAPALLRTQKQSAIMGHNQKTDVAFHPVSHQWAIFSGCCYLHDEDYLGPQGNDVRRQILVLHEVEDGKFDPMFVSLRFLEKSYS
jgi:hypothetical protein